MFFWLLIWNICPPSVPTETAISITSSFLSPPPWKIPTYLYFFCRLSLPTISINRFVHLLLMHLYLRDDHRFGQGVTSFFNHQAYPGSIPYQVSFPGSGFFQGFPSTVRRFSGKRRPYPSRDIINHQYHFIRVPMTSDVDVP